MPARHPAVVLLITVVKLHPFLSLVLGSAVLGAVATMPPGGIVDSFTTGFGSTAGSVGILIALAAILGLPLFFEVDVVLLAPVIILVARRTGLSLMKIGIPALAGLAVLHGLVPPHPGPLTAIGLLNADLALTLLFGIIVAIPTVIVAGPFLATFVDRWVPEHADAVGYAGAGAGSGSARPSWPSRCRSCSCCSTRSPSSSPPTRTTGSAPSPTSSARRSSPCSSP